jgi:hypothetical protein
VCVKEERLGGEENYDACVETTRRLALPPEAGPVETLKSGVSVGPV